MTDRVGRLRPPHFIARLPLAQDALALNLIAPALVGASGGTNGADLGGLHCLQLLVETGKTITWGVVLNRRR